jgi:transposase
MTDPLPLRLDVSKAKFNACLIRESGKLRHSSFANSPAGFTQLSQWLAKLGAGTAHACMEATGTYYEALAGLPS